MGIYGLNVSVKCCNDRNPHRTHWYKIIEKLKYFSVLKINYLTYDIPVRKNSEIEILQKLAESGRYERKES